MIHGVFLDTNVFESAKFKYTGNNLESLLSFCHERDIPVYVDKVVYGEVKNRIALKAHEVTVNLKNEHIEFLGRVTDIEKGVEDKLKDSLLEDFKELFEEGLLTILPTKYDQEKLLDIYFQEEAPFNVDGKKSEFPDAIMMLSVDKYAQDNAEEIMVVSNDNGVREYCKTSYLRCCEYASQALSSLNEQFDLNKLFIKYKTNIEEQILRLVNDGSIYFNIYGYTYEDFLESTYIIDNVKIKDLSLIHEDDEAMIMEVSGKVVIDFIIDTEPYPDYDSGTYDKEDGVWYVFSHLKTKFSHRYIADLSFVIEVEDAMEGYLHASYTKSDIDIEFDPYSIPSGNIINQVYFDDSDRDHKYIEDE